MMTCKFCGESIEWAAWAHNRHRVPLEPRASRSGDVVILDGHTAPDGTRLLRPARPADPPEVRRVNHLTRCRGKR